MADSLPILFTQLGAALSIGLCAIGSAYGTSKSGLGLTPVSKEGENQELMNAAETPQHKVPIMKQFISIIISGVIAIYGLIIAVIINAKRNPSYETGYSCFGAGLSMGLCGLASGIALGTFGERAVRRASRDPSFYVPMVLVLIFIEAIGLYGLIVALLSLMNTN